MKNFNFIDSVFAENREFSLLSDTISSGENAVVTDLSQIGRAAVISASVAKNDRRAAAVCPDEGSATRLYYDLSAFGKKALLLPERDLCSQSVASSREWEHKRIFALASAAGGDYDVLVGSAAAFTLLTLPPRLLLSNIRTLRAGDKISPRRLCEALVSAGYVRAGEVEGAGQFALRGGICDIFPPTLSRPVRIEFWGDEIDTLSYFDPNTQRRDERAEELPLSPAREALAPEGGLAPRLFELSKKDCSAAAKERIDADLQACEQGVFTDYDRYLAVAYDKPYSALDYIPDAVLFICDCAAVRERCEGVCARRAEELKADPSLISLPPGTEKQNLDADEFFDYAERGAVLLESFAKSGYDINIKPRARFSIPTPPVSPWRGGFSALCDDISGDTVIFAGNEKAAAELSRELCESGRRAVFLREITDRPRGIIVTVGGVSSGMRLASERFTLLTHSDLLRSRSVKKKQKNRADVSLDDIKIGDYVFHAAHGIGRFDGVNKITRDGVSKDYIKISYSGGDNLYVPVGQLDFVSKYVGAADGENVKLSRLGGADWQKTRTRVRAAVKDMARELTELYKKRLSIEGHAFPPDGDIQADFERRFEYEETDDQLRCAEEIKTDMQRPSPMDRLLCGDVGVGKTEVALRAAFKCISDGKQCAVLAPTTILAWQHYNTVLRRFDEFPVEIRLMSRFVSKADQSKTLKELARGAVDLVVGTHRLISKDVRFRDLGLIIIDEEHRFGVAQKERLKELYPSVDVLTLSATPIPRTLNMAMSGLRDMSSIDEAPEDRLPVQTFVVEQDDALIYDAISRELRRDGQVYYLHNRVESIYSCAAAIQNRLPDASVGVAHGKMSEDELSRVWQRLLDHEIDILVCTTIIETGVDVPNANTLIIENADNFGLSQLHQLRGRVGRSPRKAYAYFCFRRGRALTEIAEKRLETIREYTEFGSGFKIAMRDLEIRGAGNLLGAQQHGHLESVGYDMYVRMLREAIDEEKGVAHEKQTMCSIDLNIDAHIPESYIESLPQRLGIYRRIADIKTDDDRSDVIDELCDRFGEPPREVLGLIDAALLKSRAAAVGFAEIIEADGAIILYRPELPKIFTAFLAARFGKRFSYREGKRPCYRLTLDGKPSFTVLSEALTVIESCPKEDAAEEQRV